MTLQVASVVGTHPRIYFALASSTLMISVVQEEGFLHPGSFQWQVPEVRIQMSCHPEQGWTSPEELLFVEVNSGPQLKLGEAAAGQSVVARRAMMGQ